MDLLTIAPHPDDETLGCGGTLLRYAAAGCHLHWLIVTTAEGTRYAANAETDALQIGAVKQAYPFTSTSWLKLPVAQLDTLPMATIVGGISEVVESVRPEVVFVPNRSDVHSDHRVTFEASMAVLKSFAMRALGVRRVLACEIPSETDAAASLADGAFLPNVFVDVSATQARRLEILKLYASELHDGFLPRTASAVGALARYRGASIGVEYAEAFMLIREIEP